MLDINFYISNLSRNADIIATLLNNLSGDEIRWRPAEGKWNLLEIICHLRDEEKEDFKPRLLNVLEDPKRSWNNIEPANWVIERNYSSENIQVAIHDFMEERKRSITWLSSLHSPDWTNTYQHPQLGPMTAAYILANWMAHDLIHLRQIIKVKYAYLAFLSGENHSYAGNW